MDDAATPVQSSPLHRLAVILRRRKGLVVLPVVACTSAALAVTASRPQSYTATTSVLFRNDAVDQQLFGNSFVSGQDPDRVAATNVELLRASVVARRTAAALGDAIPDVQTPGQVHAHVKISPEGVSDVVDVAATAGTARGAARLANTYAGAFINLSRDAAATRYDRAVATLTSQIAGGAGGASPADIASLRSRLSQLRALGAVQTGGVRLVEAALPPRAPSGPRVVRGTVAGFLVGLAFALLLVALVERVDNRLRDPEDAEDAFGMTLIGTVPRDGSLRRGSGSPSHGAGARDAFGLLRAQLRYFNVDKPVTSLLITSPSSGDGKSTVAWNLSRAEAAARDSPNAVVLLEADLRRPTLAEHPGLRVGPGLAELLGRVASLDQVLQPVDVGRGAGTSATSMHVITAGDLPPNPAELLESRRAEAVMAELHERFSLIVIDAPPTLVVSDAIPLIPLVSGVLMVGRVGHTTRSAARRLHTQLVGLRAPALGVVLNGIPQPAQSYYYAAASPKPRHAA